MPYQAVIFDLDGTLLDTLRDLADATNAALNQLGFPPHETAEYKYFVGEGREMLAWRALPTNQREPGTVTHLVNLIDTEYSANWSRHTRPYEGIPELLDGLTARKIPIAVLSNKTQYFVDITVRNLLAKWSFKIVLGVSFTIPKKPDITGVHHIINQFNIKPGKIVYLGDTDIDMKTAVAAGLFPVGALWGFRTAAELTAGGAGMLISNPRELLKLF